MTEKKLSDEQRSWIQERTQPLKGISWEQARATAQETLEKYRADPHIAALTDELLRTPAVWRRVLARYRRRGVEASHD